MHKTFLIIGAFLGLFAVAIGAFGAHALSPHLSEKAIQTFQTASRYHFYHAFALLAVGILQIEFKNKLVVISGYLFLTGVILFSGSLYLLSTREILGIEHWSFLGPITPLGGILLISGWIALIAAVIKK